MKYLAHIHSCQYVLIHSLVHSSFTINVNLHKNKVWTEVGQKIFLSLQIVSVLYVLLTDYGQGTQSHRNLPSVQKTL